MTFFLQNLEHWENYFQLLAHFKNECRKRPSPQKLKSCASSATNSWILPHFVKTYPFSTFSGLGGWCGEIENKAISAFNKFELKLKLSLEIGTVFFFCKKLSLIIAKKNQETLEKLLRLKWKDLIRKLRKVGPLPMIFHNFWVWMD